MALKEQDIVFTTKDATGNTVLQMPITRLDNVEGALKTVNNLKPDANGNVNIGVGVTSINGATGAVTLKDYVTGLSVSGKTITYTKKDGTSGKITTRDTVPTDYVTGLSVSGKTVTYTKKDGTSGTITTQDTAYTHPSTHPASMITGLATVATSGSYNDLSNKPSIPPATRMMPNYRSFVQIGSGDFTPTYDGWIRLYLSGVSDHRSFTVKHKASDQVILNYAQARYPGSGWFMCPLVAGETYTISSSESAIYFHPMR